MEPPPEIETGALPGGAFRSKMPSKKPHRDLLTDPDLDVLHRVAEGEGAACAELADRHLGRIVAFAERMLGDRGAAEEVAQEVFLRIWKHAGRWKPGQALFSTWVHKVALNLCYDRLRSRRESALPEGYEQADSSDGPEMSLSRREQNARVSYAVASLPDRQRAAITMCHFQEMRNIEAAEVLGITGEALVSLLARGRRRLRELLADEEFPE